MCQCLGRCPRATLCRCYHPTAVARFKPSAIVGHCADLQLPPTITNDWNAITRLRAPSLPAGRRPSLVRPIRTKASVITCDKPQQSYPLLTATTVYDDMEDRASRSPLRLELLRKPILMSESCFFFPSLSRQHDTTESAHRLSFPVHDYSERSYRRFVFRQ